MMEAARTPQRCPARPSEAPKCGGRGPATGLPPPPPPQREQPLPRFPRPPRPCSWALSTLGRRCPLPPRPHLPRKQSQDGWGGAAAPGLPLPAALRGSGLFCPEVPIPLPCFHSYERGKLPYAILSVRSPGAHPPPMLSAPRPHKTTQELQLQSQKRLLSFNGDAIHIT